MDTPRAIAETPDFLVIEKPEGLLVHPGPHSGDEATLTAWLLPRYPEIRVVGDAPETRPGIVHRLDRGTSGVMLVARTRQAFADLKELFQSREMKKEYRALVHGVMHPAEGRIDRAIGIKPHTTKRSVFSTQMSKPAITRYLTVEQLAAIAHVAAFPETGRTHQIRVHFSSLGHPVLGDTLYAPKRKDPAVTRLMLHAHRISFTYRGVENTFTSDVPEAFETVLHTQRVLAEGGV